MLYAHSTLLVEMMHYILIDLPSFLCFIHRIGFKVAEHPWYTIALCWLIVICCSFGFILFNHEKDPLKLWVPKGQLRQVEMSHF